jgi:hypothetical protein
MDVSVEGISVSKAADSMPDIGAYLEVMQPQPPKDFGRAKNTYQEGYELSGRSNDVHVRDVVPDQRQLNTNHGPDEIQDIKSLWEPPLRPTLAESHQGSLRERLTGFSEVRKFSGPISRKP